MAANLLYELNTGQQMPMVGLGTFRVRGTSVIYNVIKTALGRGYRSIDTAAVYQNETDIGSALTDLLPRYGLKREDIFITSKLAPEDHHPDRVQSAVLRSLSQLQTPYLDLFLVHWPGTSGIPAGHSDNPRLRRSAWNQLVLLHQKGLLKAIGVSNFTIRHIDELLEDCGGVKPSVNQVEIHPHYPQKDLVSHCQRAGIHVQAYSSFGGTNNRSLLTDPVIIEVAQACRREPAQVLLRWALQQNIGVIPKAVSEKHIVDNFDLDFVLSESQMTKINSIQTNKKYAWNPEVVA
ncbi:glyoxal reductase-like [Thrips palmi]|uniref:Glyoxal reductase-like n=1 Tax=Thrips palmi TaxID=161013 RepID=A0A6P8YYW6_THRPL|nr:glyoxal reductase-like [Thrips palmi]